MEEIELIVGDSGNIYQFSSKQVASLTSDWEGSWVVSDKLGSEPILTGSIVKNDNIFNSDSLVDEEFRKTFKLFEALDNNLEKVVFNDDVIIGEVATISGRIYTEGTDGDGNPTEVPVQDKYITLTIKGIFSGFKRSIRVQSDTQGKFTTDLNIGNTIKTPANSFFIFQMMPLESEQLEEGKSYVLSIEVRQLDELNVIQFRKEVLQARLRMKAQGVE